MERFIFFIYTVLSADERYAVNDRRPIYATIFLITFFEAILLLPLLLLMNSYFPVIDIKSFLALPTGLRYLVILILLSLLCFLNYQLFASNHKIESIAERLEPQKQAYLKYKWLLMLIPVMTGGIMLLSIWFLRHAAF